MRFQPETTTNDELHIHAGHMAFQLRRLRDGDAIFSATHLKEHHEGLQQLYLEIASDDPLLKRPVDEDKTLNDLLQELVTMPTVDKTSDKDKLQGAISDLFGIYRMTSDGLCTSEAMRHYWLTGER